MRIDPALRALRSNSAPQRIAQIRIEQAKAAWMADTLVSGVAEDLKKFAAGDDLRDCKHLSDLFQPDGMGVHYAETLMSNFLPALTDQPLGQMPFRHDYRDGQSTLVIEREGSAILSLHLSEEVPAKSQEIAGSVRFSCGERHEFVVAGAADIKLIERKSRQNDPASLCQRSLRLSKESTLSLDCGLQTTIVERIDGRLMRLRLARTPDNPLPSQQFLLEDGSLIHQSAGRQSESRQELMLALLVRMERADGAPLMAKIAEEAEEGSDHLRWQALRETLALDTAKGFAALCSVAANASDGLSAPASELRAQLLDTYPALSSIEMEAEPCPA